jgi:hypothetical protein
MKTFTFLLVAFFVVLSPIQAQWNQIGQDIDGEAEYDQSGWSVSLNSDGSVVAIGAPENDGGGLSLGQVRIYHNLNGSWVQTGQSLYGNENYDEFGISVSLNSDGSVVAVGAPNYDITNASYAGVVFIYKNINGNWEQYGDSITGKTPFEYAGTSVSLSSDGNIVAIGVPWNCGNGEFAGQVRVYGITNGIWTQIGQDIDGEATYDYSGYSISLSSDGSVVAIGAYGNTGNGLNAGQVRVYRNVNGTWIQTGQDIDGEAEGDYSGWSVSLSADGSVVAIGAMFNDGNGTDAGHVRVYKNINETWIQMGQDIDGEEANDQSGRAVSINSDGTIVAVGAPYNNGSTGQESGQVRIYKYTDGNWIQIGQDVDGETEYNDFGKSVSLSSDGFIMAAGAPYNCDNGINAGHVRVFEYPSTEVPEILNPEIVVYPNPTKGFFKIESTNVETGKVTICDVTGKVLIETGKELFDKTYDLSDFNKGMYILKIQLDNKIVTTGIIKY